MTKEPATYPIRYVEDFVFGVSNEGALSPEALARGKVKLSKSAA